MNVDRPIRPATLFVAAILLFLAVTGAPARDETPAKRNTGPSRTFVVDGSPVHDVGNVRVHASNWGAFGSSPGTGLPYAGAPSCEWPAGSQVEYVYEGGLWVGALLDGTPAVSTSVQQLENRPTVEPGDVVYYAAQGDAGGARIPMPGADDDHDGSVDEDWHEGYDNDFDRFADEDFAAISDQMLSRRFQDDTPQATAIYPQHRPMHLAVREESYQWRDSAYDDFVGFTFWITNTGEDTLRSVYVGVYTDGDVGHRARNNYWNDDATGFDTVMVDHAPGTTRHDFAYWYDVDGDAGQAPGYAGILILDHPTDPLGIDAPPSVRATSAVNMLGSLSYPQGGPPTNDFERYELMSSGKVGQNIGGDVTTLVAMGPFAQLYPGETIRFSFALVVTPRDDFSNVRRAADVYHGRWFDIDGDPLTGIRGREHNEHWYLPTDTVETVAFGFVSATADEGVIALRATYQAGMHVREVAVYRGPEDVAFPMDRIGTVPPCGCGAIQFIDRDVISGHAYRYQFGVVDGEGEHLSPLVMPTAGPVEGRLSQNRPNPFNPRTTIHFTLPARAATTLVVYGVSGGRVRTLVDEELARGPYAVEWDGQDDDGQPVSSGMYFYRLVSGTYSVSRKMMLIK
ncbi:MAG: hypothetical protein OEX18_00310 [Candidatus Krumholzibacteria bacterium]|nr:hypothetical protein [Candidatus Krumholzibacteria bacterium]MDH4335704.1 hypothetical protein [Candidatus Krumholzibacteria bacterium]MDH5270049.1 hypothetical protein [Candidatus Krumholzibacteria bacterium]MDH5627095.1 hypothetical protein [Candidatus Krumholzibacteria bacterium]